MQNAELKSRAKNRFIRGTTIVLLFVSIEAFDLIEDFFAADNNYAEETK